MGFFWRRKEKQEIAEESADSIKENLKEEEERLPVEDSLREQEEVEIPKEDPVSDQIEPEISKPDTEATESEESNAENTESEQPGKISFFKRLVRGLSKTRDNIVNGFDSVFSGFSHIDEDFYEELEEILVMGDIGIHATTRIIERLQEQVKQQHIKDPPDCKQLLIDTIKEEMNVGETAYRFENEKSVVLVIGVNGVGKTTTIGKLAGKFKHQNKKKF